MKTPEQMAEEYAKTEGQPWGCEQHFLAGYKAAQQWISVKDRLPDKSPMVLAMCIDGYELAYYGMYGQGWTNTLGTEHLNVTHWQPLPEAPKEEE